MRVDIDRLDSLMNLIGELVVNRARLAQIAQQIAPALRQTSALHQLREFATQLADHGRANSSRLQARATGMFVPTNSDEGLAVLHYAARRTGRSSRKSLGPNERSDRPARPASPGNLQQGVMETRMVPVGPLFNRFQRVIRDLSKERGKQVHLQLRGERYGAGQAHDRRAGRPPGPPRPQLD